MRLKKFLHPSTHTRRRAYLRGVASLSIERTIIRAARYSTLRHARNGHTRESKHTIAPSMQCLFCAMYMPTVINIATVIGQDSHIATSAVH